MDSLMTQKKWNAVIQECDGDDVPIVLDIIDVRDSPELIIDFLSDDDDHDDAPFNLILQSQTTNDDGDAAVVIGTHKIVDSLTLSFSGI